ncbi:RxLR effector protein [Phytophthora megakarya]|uniref:RxLR effector protein n=1 Tax=Phytophthora megakarya TaxID=4795 RepID=A0A225VBH4_9STRA|nr:RxLR effector protein [Phytophthora megakarya]
MTDKEKAVELIDELLGNERLTKAAYIWWQHNHHTLVHIDNFLKLASQKSRKSYDNFYNGYVLHLYD